MSAAPYPLGHSRHDGLLSGGTDSYATFDNLSVKLPENSHLAIAQQ